MLPLTDDDIGVLTKPLERSLERFERKGKVGVGKDDVAAAGSENATPDGPSFAKVPWVSDERCAGRQVARLNGLPRRAPVIHDNKFCPLEDL